MEILSGNFLMTFVLYTLIVLVLLLWVEHPTFLAPNSLILRRHPGDELESWLKNFHWGSKHELGQAQKIPGYKFYSDVIEIILTLARKIGGSYQENLLFLREGLQLDRQFEKKIREALLGLWFQMLFMLALTWGFIFAARAMVQVQINPASLILILSWQLTGLGVLPLILRFLRRKYFGEIGKLWKILFVMKSLEKIPLARSEIMRLAGVNELENIRQKSLSPIMQKLRETCEKTLKLGVSYEGDVKYLMEELRFQEKWHFELFEKRLTVIKLILLSVFFLPSYLAFVFLLLGDLMASL